ncbi:hypothetical protein KY348_04510 [Candidatus Woesearchaeota archaeon]|nr:hypothetical protein [Candidatus Woesearchaeota archaeon]
MSKKIIIESYNLPDISGKELTPYGKIISPEEAMETILKVPGPNQEDIGRWYLDIFNQHIDTKKVTGIRYIDCNDHMPLILFAADYLVGKNKENNRIEMRLTGGDGPLGWMLTMKLQYDGNDINFEPRIPEIPTKGLLHKLGLKKVKEPTKEEKFPLLQKKKGAQIWPGKNEHGRTETRIKVKDKRLEELANKIYQSIESIRTSQPQKPSYIN